MRNSLRSALAATALILCAGTAAAGDQAGPANDDRGVCKQDVQRLCPDARGGAEVFRCLNEHESDLSDACRQRLVQRKQHFEARVKSVEEACREDIARHCEKIEQGGGRVLQCLRQHEPELSEGCRVKLPAARGKGRPPAQPPQPQPQPKPAQPETGSPAADQKR